MQNPFKPQSGILAILILLLCVSKNWAQIDKYSGSVLFKDTTKNTAVWTEIIDNQTTKLKLGTSDGKSNDEILINSKSCSSTNYSKYDVNPDFTILVVNELAVKCKDKNTKSTGGIFIINNKSKKFKSHFIFPLEYNIRVASYWYDNYQLLLTTIDGIDNEGIILYELATDKYETEFGDLELFTKFNNGFVLQKSEWDSKKDKNLLEHFFFDIKTKQRTKLPYKFENMFLSSSFSVGDENYIVMKTFGKDKNAVFKIDLAKEKYIPAKEPDTKDKVIVVTMPHRDSEILPSTVKYFNLKNYWTSFDLTQKLSFCNELLYKAVVNLDFVSKNLLEIVYKELINEYPLEEKVIELGKKFLPILTLSSTMDILEPSLKSNSLNFELYEAAKKKIWKDLASVKTLSVKENDKLEFLFAQGEKLGIQNFATRTNSQFDLELFKLWRKDRQLYNLYVSTESIVNQGREDAFKSYIMTTTPLLSGILNGNIYSIYGEALLRNAIEYNDTTNASAIIDVLNDAINAGLIHDATFVALIKAHLYLKNDFKTADALMLKFKKNFSGYAKAEVWIKNFEFNAGIHAFKLGQYQLAKSYLLNYVSKDEEFGKDAYLRLFESAYRLNDINNLVNAHNWLLKNFSEKELIGYFPNYLTIKSVLNTPNIPLESNVLRIEELERLFTKSKKGVENSQSFNYVQLARITADFDSLGLTQKASSANLVLSNLNYKSKKYDVYKQQIQRCIELSKDDFSCHKNYAIYLLDMGKTEEALKFITPHVAQNPQNEDLKKAMSLIHNTLASNYLKNSEYNKAIEEYEKSNSFVQNDVALMMTAYTYMKLGNNTQKEQYLMRAFNLNYNVLKDYPDFKTLLKL